MCNIFCKQEFFLSGFKNEAMFIDTITKQDPGTIPDKIDKRYKRSA